MLFLVDAATFLVYIAVLLALVPEPPGPCTSRASAPAAYRDVVRNRPFMGVFTLNTVLIFAGLSCFELLPVYAKNNAAVTERQIGLVFFVNTVVIVLLQLPIAKLSQGRRRMPTLTLLGRYMALSALSWQLGFTLGPALGGFMLALSPTGLWLGAAAICGLAGLAALPLERTLPYAARRTLRPGGLQAAGVESRTIAMTIDDPLSPHAEPAPHPTHAAAQRGGRSTPSS